MVTDVTASILWPVNHSLGCLPLDMETMATPLSWPWGMRRLFPSLLHVTEVSSPQAERKDSQNHSDPFDRDAQVPNQNGLEMLVTLIGIFKAYNSWHR